MKMLNSSEREKVKVNVIEEKDWINHYKRLYFDESLESDREHLSRTSKKGHRRFNYGRTSASNERSKEQKGART